MVNFEEHEEQLMQSLTLLPQWQLSKQDLHSLYHNLPKVIHTT